LGRDSVERLRAFCVALLFAGIVISTLGLVFDVSLHRIEAPIDVAVLTSVLLSTTALIFTLRSTRVPAHRALRIGTAYQLFLAYSMAFLTNGTAWPGALPVGWPPTAVIAFLFAVLIPMPPLKTLMVSSLTVAMDPLAKLTLLAMGYSALSRHAWLAGVLPGVGAVVLSVVASRVIHGLGESLAKARELGSYILTRRLGRGAMGEVWEARHRLLARGAAIKFIRRPPSVRSELLLKRRSQFEREARATAALRSPHSVSVYDYGIARDGTFFYVMELLDGIDLATLVTKHGPLPAARVVNILLQVCLSLEDAHERGLIHRDVKPGNIFLSRLGSQYDFVKVLDFGLAAWVDDATGSTDADVESSASGIVGTPAFLAPEQAMGLAVDGRADLYSLGCVGYWLLTGRLVFDGAAVTEVIARHILEPPPPMARGSVPLALEAILLRCLAKKPEQRFPSVRAMRRALLDLDVAPWTDDDAQVWWSQRAAGTLSQR